MKKILLLLFSVFLFFSCDPNTTSDEINPGDISVDDFYPVVHRPVVYDITTDSPFSINKGNLFQDNIVRNFLSGIYEITYNGTEYNNSIEFKADFYHSDNRLLYSYENYIYNNTKQYQTETGYTSYTSSAMASGENAVLPIISGDLTTETLPNGLFEMKDIAYINITFFMDNTLNTIPIETDDRIVPAEPVSYNKETFDLSVSLTNLSADKSFQRVQIFYYFANVNGDFVDLSFMTLAFNNDPVLPGETRSQKDNQYLYAPYLDSVKYILNYKL